LIWGTVISGMAINPFKGTDLGSLLAQAPDQAASGIMELLFPGSPWEGVSGHFHTSPVRWGESTFSLCIKKRRVQWMGVWLELEPAEANFQLRYSPLESVSIHTPANLVVLFKDQIQKQLKRGVGAPLWVHDPRRGYTMVVSEPLPKEWDSFPVFDVGGEPSQLPIPYEGAAWKPYQDLWGQCGQCGTPFQRGVRVVWSTSYTRWVCPDCV